MHRLLDRIETVQHEVYPRIDPSRKAQYGQFMTPPAIARFMASLFPASTLANCRLLDAGAGAGSLTSAFLDRWADRGFGFEHLDVHAHEIDDSLRESLERTLAKYAARPGLTAQVSPGDFIENAVEACEGEGGGYTHAILNPPYKKINASSPHRLTLRRAGIETVNLYSAFVALAVELMAPGGIVVAIIPRSFCNGPYYRPFRDFILGRAAIRHMHLFNSRSKAFKDDDVLQENVIIMLERGGRPGKVVVSTSTDDTFSDLVMQDHPANRIILPDDPQGFIHIPTSIGQNAIEASSAVRCSLDNIGVKVSTGPVVDFRLRDHLRAMPESGTVPLLYPGHLTGSGAEWPRSNFKKPNAIQRNAETEKWLYPNGFYCVVRRFSSKEERRRIVASVVQPSAFGDAKMLGFENHLNVFHDRKHGLPEALARGLAAFLNTSAVEENFRRFNGHTQVNATDLKLMKYPSRNSLIRLGEWTMTLDHEPSQEQLDAQFDKLSA